MTYSGNFNTLIDSVVDAGQAAPATEAGGQDNTASLLHAAAGEIDPRCASLLSRLLTQADARAGTPCVQFVVCTDIVHGPSIVFGTAHAAANLLGRTLLLNARLETAGAAICTGGTAVPDAFLPRLYHRRLTSRAADAALLFGPAREDVLKAMAAPFRLVIIESRSPAQAPAATSLARLCLGTVLLVAAGRTRLPLVQETARHIQAAGGRIIGAVLTDAPSRMPQWVRA